MSTFTQRQQLRKTPALVVMVTQVTFDNASMLIVVLIDISWLHDCRTLTTMSTTVGSHWRLHKTLHAVRLLIRLSARLSVTSILVTC